MSAEQSVTMAECLSLVADELTVLEVSPPGPVEKPG